jgi:dihydropteroate synthase
VSAAEEMDRVLPVIEQLARRIDAPISIDTTKADVADAALSAGAAMLNDISALRLDERLADVAARHDVPVVLMHMRGEPRTMQVDPVYADVVGEVRQFLGAAIDRATAAGIDRRKLIIDPGIGFGKTGTHNLLLIRHLAELTGLDTPLLVGPSRKAFIRKLLASTPRQEPSPDHPEVETGTQAAVAAAVLNGAHIVRVHDAANTRAMLKVLDAIRTAGNS